ncbi:DeoR/GlpR family DNA-binding transcription regulator [Devriesea agamarum]|uniref:DeoR/GlpR family DNA-binding transcription regulator n=1 Tax=Devriesea agamarum TaxID=472569 RepID=UPI00071DCFF0|nr:DeoR/GlpR family DNA-binding transcription regulator [Devriesea agamarum]
MQRSSRHKTIIRALGTQPVSVDALVQLTGASAITIRRDLADLAGHGLLRRIHGGAVAVNLRGTPQPYALRAAEHADDKESIARLVASLIHDDMSIILDNGSTTVAIAHALVGKPLTALCLSLRSAVPLGESEAATVITPGGQIKPGSLRTTASESIAALKDFRADVAIIGTCSATPSNGLTVTTHEDAKVKQAIIASSAHVILAATGDKLSRTSSFRFADLDDINDLVTTADAPESALDEFRTAGVIVHIAD